MKRALVLLISLITVVGLLPLSLSAETEYSFDDVSSDAWYKDAAEYCYEKGYVFGTSEREFSPDIALTRAMMVTMLARLSGEELGGYTEKVFDDVDTDSWYSATVCWAYEKGIALGTGNSRFSPDDDITREQLCRFMHGFYKRNGRISEYNEDILDGYIDKEDVSSWALEDVSFAVANSVIKSTSSKDLVLSPRTSVTRAEAAQVFMNYKKQESFLIILDPCGGEMAEEAEYSIKIGEEYSALFGSALPVPVKEGCSFLGWYCGEKDIMLDIDGNFNFEEDITFTALWKDNDPYLTALKKVSQYKEEMLDKYKTEKRDEEIIDIILFAGQSNSSGRVTAEELVGKEDIFVTVDTSKAFTFYNNKFTTPQKIEEPIKGNGTDSKYYGYIPAFLDSYYDSTGRRACACFKSVGGMMLNQFLPYTIDEEGNETNDQTKFYKEMVDYIDHAKNNLVNNGYKVGNILMVWCQGEADAAYYGYDNAYANAIEKNITEYEDKISYYKSTFIRLFESLKKDAGLEKVFFVRIGHSNKSEECLRNQCIIEAHSQLCRENDDFVMVNTLFAGAKTYRNSEGEIVNLMRDASHYTLECYIMAGREAAINAAIYINSGMQEKPMLFEYHTPYLEAQGVSDTTEYQYEYQKYIYYQ